MKIKEPTNEVRGCLVIIATLSISTGIGVLFGWGWGFIGLGIACISLVVIDAVDMIGD